MGTPEVCVPRWWTPEHSMCTRLGLGHNFRYKYYGSHLASTRTKIKIMKRIKLWPNSNLVHILRSGVRHLVLHTSGVPRYISGRKPDFIIYK